MSSWAVNGVPALLSLVSFAFFVAASVGYSDKEHTLRHIPWITGKYSGILGSGNVYFGLRSVYNAGADSKIDFGAENCPFRFCDECKRDGDAAFGLLITATLLTFWELITCCASIPIGGTVATTQWVQMAVALTAAVLSLVALVLFMNNCYDAIDDNTGFDLAWGPGAALTVLGMLLMWFDVVAHIVGAVYCSP